MKISQLGEFALIDTLKKFAPASKEVIKGIGDDAAVLTYSKSKYLLFTTDMLAEGTHFTRRMPPQMVGHKALACSISDIAAMGGFPTFAVISIGIPKALPLSFIKDVYKGIQCVAKAFNVSMVGGDTIKTDKIVINIALLGVVEKKYLTTRDGAKAGDGIFVTGPLGGSLKSGRHLNFTPRLSQARFLVENFKPGAMMDISDGLSGDLNHMLKASRVGARLNYASIPRHKGASLPQALNDGEDFELLFTLTPLKARLLMDWQAKGLSFPHALSRSSTGHSQELGVKVRIYLIFIRLVQLRLMLKKKSIPKVSLISNSEEETKLCARHLAEDLKPGDIVLLQGDLGAGKTTFVKGLVQGFKVSPKKVNSPTFVLMNYYKGKLPFYHFDLYRLGDPKELDSLDFDEYLYGKGISLIEWPERLGEHKPREYYLVEFEHKGEQQREITISSRK